MTTVAIGLAVGAYALLTSCTVTTAGGAPVPMVGNYRADGASIPLSTDLAPGDVDTILPETDSAGIYPSGFARLRTERNAPLALATRQGRIEQVDAQALITREFERYDPAYLAHKEQRERRLDALKNKLMESEESGTALPCSRRMMIEAEWLLDYTAEWQKLDLKLTALEDSLAIKDQRFALRQTADGSWGACYDAWFEKINGTVNVVSLLPTSDNDQAAKVQYPFSILQRIDSLRLLIPYLYGLQVSRIADTGVYEREELGAIEGALSQFLFKKQWRAILAANGAPFIGQEYVDTYRRFLDDTQDHTSGYWGPWIIAEGQIIHTADLSQTFHAISYRNGAVNHWPEIVETTLAIKELPYPFGWRHNGNYNNHNDYDVVKILHLGWPTMTLSEIDRSRTEIRKMLTWALADSVTVDGQFRDDPSFYDSVGEAYYYGISFLAEVGYWNQDRRFWDDSTASYAGATTLCRKIGKQLAQLQIDSMAAQQASTELSKSCGDLESR